MPTISVIVPVYKVEAYLDRCVKSILAQTYTDFELILVDDGSPDNCPAMCDAWAEKDSRIVVIHQANGGLSAARNAGIDWAFAHSDSEWLTFIDSDDWVHPQFLAKLLDVAEQNGVAVSVCGYAAISGEEPAVDTEARAILRTPESFFIEKIVNGIVAWGKLYRKACFADIRYPVGRLYEDGFTTHKLLFMYDKVAYISAPLYFYYQNPNGIMRSSFSLKKYDSIVACEERAAFFRERGFTELAENEQKRIRFEIAHFAIAARKAGIYDQVPEQYRMGWWKAMRTVRSMCSKDQFEWVIVQYHPFLVKLSAIVAKIFGFS